MEKRKAFWSKWNDGSVEEILKEWKWILCYSRQHTGSIFAYILFGISGSAFSLMAAVASQRLIDTVTGQRNDQVLVMAAMMVSTALVSLLFNAWISRASLKISIDIQNDIQADIFEKLEDISWMELQGYHSGDILKRFDSDVHIVAADAISWLPALAIDCFQFLAVFCVIFYYDPVMAFLTLVSAPCLLLSSRYFMGKLRSYGKQVRELDSHMMAFEQETFHNINTIKAFGITERYTRKLKDWQKTYKDYYLDYNLFSIKTRIFLCILGMFGEYGAFGWSVYRLWSGYITYGQMTLFLTQGAKLSSAINSLISFMPSALNSAVSAGRVMELLELPREQHDSEGTELMQRVSAQGLTVMLDQVSFGYNRERRILVSSDFRACPNEIVAMVGPSGEGKTTLIRMILGLIAPDSGKACLVNVDGQHIRLNADTRQFFSYVPQGNTVFSGTIADNLRMIREDASDEELVEALQAACAWEFVEQIPDGLYGTLGEKGQGLSEGQAQRLAIARAVLRDAPILLLDEATSALDVETERNVLRNIMHMKPNRICIVVTHRPSVLNLCQRIYRVMDTRVTELDQEAVEKLVKDF